MSKNTVKETELYGPVKRYLQAQGYEVKAEIGEADVVARRGQEEPVIVELKTRFSLALFHQAVARQSLSDTVYVAVPRSSTPGFHKSLEQNTRLCRRLGLGLLSVNLRTELVVVHVDPAPYRPRKSKARQGRLLGEFERRVGDPNEGGATRQRLVTAYRQDALRCVRVLHSHGASRAAEVARLSGVEKAQRLMYDDHYGWFERASRGVYRLSPKGIAATRDYRAELAELAATGNATL